jgi:hypothetical protein
MELIAGVKSNPSGDYRFDIDDGSLDEELNSILSSLQGIHQQDLGFQMETYMGLMARCTEIKVYCLEREGRDRKLKVLRTQKLQPIIELVEFLWRGASRLVEMRRIEVELSR